MARKAVTTPSDQSARGSPEPLGLSAPLRVTPSSIAGQTGITESDNSPFHPCVNKGLIMRWPFY